MIGILGHQHLSNQGLGGNAAFDNASRCRGLNDCVLTRAAAIAGPTGDQNTERGRHNIKAFGNILADLVQPTAAASACPNAVSAVDIDNLFNPLQVRRQRAAVHLARTITLGLNRSSLTGRTGTTKCRLNILKAELELFGIELRGLAAETVAHERIDDRLQPLDLCVSFALGNRHVGKHAGLLKGQRT